MSKKKHKLRAMTDAEFCDKWRREHHGKCYRDYNLCPLFCYQGCCNSKKPCKVNGKYILVEVIG